jgi:hypothetical protein
MMRTIPEKLRQAIAADPFMATCIHSGELNPTWEHAWTYAGRQINERWAIVPCARRFNNDAHGEVKRFSQFIALWRLTTAAPEYFNAQIEKYPKFDFWSNFFALCLEFSPVEHAGLIERIQQHRIMG